MGPADVGIYIPQVTASYDEVLAQARRIEALGFGSFWLFDHLYTPGLPDRPALEAWTTATALLAHTSTLRVGHLVLDNNLRHPALLAKMVATLDVVSAGRFELGIGSGSVALEHEQAGLPWGSFAERSGRLGEALEILVGALTNETFSFSGQHYEVQDLPFRPAPVQRPHPPIHVGGVGERHTLPLVARHADVWNIPTYGLADWRATSAVLDACCESIGRDPATLRRSHEAVLVLAADEPSLAAAKEKALRRYPGRGFSVEEGGYVGTPSRIVDHLGAQIEAGIDQFVFIPYDRGAADALDLLAGEVLPHFA